ncbi:MULTISPECIES: phage tail protein [Listeria]|uniref:phage tail protein n=1 Tax=Listeria TaxID=1637 RepID=UPI000B58DFAA|nr:MULTISPECIES: phage tail protein [Listeria]
MYSFYDPLGKKEYLAQAEINFTHSVNGEKSISGTVELDSSVIDKIDKRWSLVFQNEKYVITMTYREDDGETVILEFEAIHEFFDVFNKSVIDTSTTGSHPYKWYLEQLFADTGYSYLLYVDVEALDKENWGMDTKMSLFADIINAGDVEYEVTDKVVHIYDKIGSDLSTIVRKGFNLQDFGVEADFSNFITYMKGYGDYFDENDQTKGRLTVEYTSPLAAQYGILAGKPYSNENFTIKENLEAKIKEQVDNSLSVSLNLTVEDLQEAGYPYAMPKCGDYITVINELMNFQQKVRIISVKSSYDIDNTRISIDVTCGSLNMADKNEATDISNGNAIDDIINGTGKIPPSWLTDFIVSASEALNNARSELKFTEQGIVAIEKNNANNLVVLNSSGMGVSTDGGKTYESAITAVGINAKAIVADTFKGVRIEGAEGYFDVIYSSFMPPLPFPQYRQELSIGSGNAFSLSAKKDDQPYPAMQMRLNTSGDLGFVIEAVNESTGVVDPDRVVRLSPFAGIETPLIQSSGWCSIGADADGKVMSIDRTTWTSGGGSIRYVPHRALTFESASSEKYKTNIRTFKSKTFGKSATEVIKETHVYTYTIEADEAEEKRIGFIAEQASTELTSEDNKSVDLYKSVAWLYQYAKEKESENQALKEEVGELKKLVLNLSERVSKLEEGGNTNGIT